MSRYPKLLTELVGTFIFFTVIALSGNAGDLAPLAIGGILMCMVFMGGHISGAHYNPAVSFAVFLRGKIDVTDLISYWLVQMVGGSLGFIFGYLVGGHTAGVHPGKGVYASSALALEIMLSAALALVVLNVAASKATSGNSFYGLAIGFTVAAGAFTIGPLSGGAFNPAVGFGATLASGIFASGSWADLWIYILGPLIGAAIAAGIHYFQIGREVPPKQVVTALGPASDSVP